MASGLTCDTALNWPPKAALLVGSAPVGRTTIALKTSPCVPDITNMITSLQILPRWGRRSALAAPSSLRTEVCPPTLRHAPAGAWQRAMFWLLAPAPQEAAPAPDRLPAVRNEFTALLADIEGDETCTLRRRIAEARSLRELWHLRAAVYRVIGLAHSQTVAEERLGVLNRHFPTRAPRSQFAPL